MNPNTQPSLSNGAQPSEVPWRTNSHPQGRNSLASQMGGRGPAASNVAGNSRATNNHLPSGAPLSDLVSQLEDYHPTIPDAVTSYYVNR